MKVREFKNGTIKLTAESKADSEHLYMFLSGGKHSPGWFTKRIGKEILKDGDESSKITIQDEAHARHLFDYWQNEQGHKFSDILTPSNT
jgi:hypothetical protein